VNPAFLRKKKRRERKETVVLSEKRKSPDSFFILRENKTNLFYTRRGKDLYQQHH